MTVKTKIAEVERWFKKIEQSYPKEQLELQDNVNAFLNAVNSIPDHLLEDYNVKFGLSIPLNTTSFRREFANRVNQSNDQALLEFYSWFDAKRKFIEKEDKICTILSQKRHLNVHRFTTAPTINSVQLHFPMPPMEFPLPPYVKPGSKVYKIHTKRPKIIRRFTVKSDPPISELYFEELHDEEVNVEDACQHMLEIMRNLVTEAHEKFPISKKHA
jgi:hypothetical protein